MTFCTSIHCIDGRIQEPIIQFIKDNYNIDYVDTITEPGPIKILTEHRDKNLVVSILSRTNISIEKHRSRLIFVSGHYDCAGNPANEDIQKQQIKDSVKYLEKTYPGIKIVGLWIDKNWRVNKI